MFLHGIGQDGKPITYDKNMQQLVDMSESSF